MGEEEEEEEEGKTTDGAVRECGQGREDRGKQKTQGKELSVKTAHIHKQEAMSHVCMLTEHRC